MKQISIFLILFLFCSCASTPKLTDVKRVDKKAEATDILRQEEHEAKSLELFNEILELAMSSKDRRAVLPRIEKLYKRIITEYPEVPLAQESYWKLITIYVEECSPPAFEKAESLYDEFSKRYPDSVFKNLIEEVLGKAYYKTGNWNKLLEISTPVFNRYTKDGNRPSSLMLFMYSEANFRLGNLSEAKRGYELAIQLYPTLKNNTRIKARLDELKDVD